MLSAELITTLAKKGRIDIIRTLKAFPGRDFTINELAKVSKVPTMTAWRAVKDLKKAGLARTRRFGNAISVSITEDREKLRSLRLVPDTDPQRSAARLLRRDPKYFVRRIPRYAARVARRAGRSLSGGLGGE